MNEIKTRYRLIFLRDYVFSVAGSEELINELNCVLFILNTFIFSEMIVNINFFEKIFESFLEKPQECCKF